MNESLKELLKEREISMYALAKKTGVPYTTVNRLVNNKLNIEDCNSKTVYELSKALGVKMEQLVNQYDYLTGTEGEYLGVKYKWTKDAEDHQLLMVVDEDQEYLAWKAKKLLTDTTEVKAYQTVVRLAVKDHLLHKQSKARLKELRKKYARK